MIDHLLAMKARAVARGYKTFLVDATGAQGYPYVILSPGYARPGEMPVCEATEAIDADVRVTCAALNGDQLLRVRDDVVALFSPLLAWHPLTVAGRLAQTRWVRHEMTAVDRDVKDPGSNLHPVYSVDTFRLVSDPNPEGGA